MNSAAGEKSFELAHAQQLQRLASVLKDLEHPSAEEFGKMGEAAAFFLGMSHAAVLYVQNKNGLNISSRPDKVTAQTLKALATCKSTSLGFFRGQKNYDVACILLPAEKPDLIDNCVNTLGEMIRYASEIWDAELKDIMTQAMEATSVELDKAIQNLPSGDDSRDAEQLENYQQALVDGKVSELSAQLQKRVESCKHCSKLAGISGEFTNDFLNRARHGLTLVANLSVRLLLNSSAWGSATATSVKIDGSKEQKLVSSLQSNQKFINMHKLEIPQALKDEMENKLKSVNAVVDDKADASTAPHQDSSGDGDATASK